VALTVHAARVGDGRGREAVTGARRSASVARAMSDLELTRTPGAAASTRWTASGRCACGAGRRAPEADGTTWEIRRRGTWRPVIDAAGTPVGAFRAGGMRRGGPIRWRGRELTLRPASRWRERYALADGERELALLDGKGWGRRPVKVTVDDPGALEPGLLLFAAFVVRGLAEDAGAAAAATAG
jgi:hypothetical protein